MTGYDAIWIASTRDPDGEPVCEITFGPVQWYAPVAAVRDTALDLVSCAAYADMSKLLVEKIGLAPGIVELMMADLLRAAGRTTNHGHPDTIMVYPAGGTRPRGRGRERQALVIFKRGSVDGMVTAAEARVMARDWMAVAEATESDQLVAEAARAVLPGADTGRLFGYLRKLREADAR